MFEMWDSRSARSVRMAGILTFLPCTGQREKVAYTAWGQESEAKTVSKRLSSLIPKKTSDSPLTFKTRLLPFTPIRKWLGDAERCPGADGLSLSDTVDFSFRGKSKHQYC